MRKPPPDLKNVKPDAPLRLDVAAALAFPDGSMTVESQRGPVEAWTSGP